MIEIPVDLGERSYPITIGHGLVTSLHDLLRPLKGRRIAVVSSRRIWGLHGRRLESSLKRLGPVSRVLVPDGERHKSLATLASVHDGLAAAGMGRDGLVVAFGGGMVGDLAGFAAATYMRGVMWVQVPTTLVAMVDSSVGGKVGVNHARAKNLVGAFHQPKAVVSDPTLLETLPLRQLRSGAYEVLKCGVIADRTLFDGLLSAPAGLAGWRGIDVENAVASACRIKAEIVEKDEREDGLRRVLNLGHTLGHALEAATAYRRFTHGEAVGWGMVGAAWLAQRKELLRGETYETIVRTVDRLGPRPKMSDLSVDKILASLRHDKKARQGRVPFVLPTRGGEVVVRPDVDPPEIRLALKAMAAREARL